MSLWIETKYINLISGKLLRFKRKSPSLYNFRCPLCSDSAKNPNKARGYFYQREGKFFFSCHNCGASYPFKRFLQQFDETVFDEFNTECLDERYDRKPAPKANDYKSILPHDNTSILSSLKSVADLPKKHVARQYVVNRKIPDKWYNELFYCADFKLWTNSLIPDKFDDTTLDEERLIIPFFDPDGNCYGYQGRALDDSKIRYVTISLNPNLPCVWGWNHVDFNYRYYVLEGPIDAMFIDNAIATAGSQLPAEIAKLGCNIENCVVVYDCEPRNEQIVKNIHKAIKRDFSVVIWPSDWPQKDINECVLTGYSIEYIHQLLKERTFRGLDAEVEFIKWKKC